MLTAFENTNLEYAAGPRLSGDAAVRVISASDFEAARQEITGWPGYAPTPLFDLERLAEELSISSLQYKHEGPRFGLGSFKSLGGSYAVFRLAQREISTSVGRDVAMAEIGIGNYAATLSKITVISATDGNHGRSVAWGAQRLGIPCRIYIHAEVSEERAQAIQDFGAQVIRVDGNYDATVDATRQDADTHGWFIVSDTSWPGYTDTPRDVMAGYGVMVHEINVAVTQPPTHVFLQGGVGGLAASVTAALKQKWGKHSPSIVIVEPELAPCLLESARAGQATAAPVSEETVMAGLSCGEPSLIAWDILAEEASDFITIPESVVAPAVRLMARPLGRDPSVEVGESAIAGLSGLICSALQEGLRSKIGLDQNSRVLLIGSEGVTNRHLFDEIMSGI